MPADILATDTLFPELNGKESTEQKFEMVTDYLWLLREQLTFALTNLGVANFNASQLTKLGNTLTEPFAVMIAEQDEKFAAFQVTIDGINGTISALDETFMKQTDFSVTANGVNVTIGETTSELASVSKLTSTASSLSSTISSVQATANSAKSTANSALGAVDDKISKSSSTQTADGFELKIMTAQRDSSENEITDNNGVVQKISAFTFNADGMTVQDGQGNVKLKFDTKSGDLTVTGTIDGSTIVGSEIYGSGFYSCDKAAVNTAAHIRITDNEIKSYAGETLYGVSISESGIYSGGFHCLSGYYHDSMLGSLSIDLNGISLNTASAGTYVNSYGQLGESGISLRTTTQSDISGDASFSLRSYYQYDPSFGSSVCILSAKRIMLYGSVYINDQQLPY